MKKEAMIYGKISESGIMDSFIAEGNVLEEKEAE